MTPEERKVYFAEYYKNNKEKIIKTMTKKVHCDLCNRIVSHCRLKCHKKTVLCQMQQKLVFV